MGQARKNLAYLPGWMDLERAIAKDFRVLGS